MLLSDWKCILRSAHKGDPISAFRLGAYFFNMQDDWTVCASAYWLGRAKHSGSIDAVYLLACLHIEKKESVCIGYDTFQPSIHAALEYIEICCSHKYPNSFAQKCIILEKIGEKEGEDYEESLENGLSAFEDWCVFQKTLRIIRNESAGSGKEQVRFLQAGRPEGRLASYGYALAAMRTLADGDSAEHARFSANAGYAPAMLLLGSLLVRQPSYAEQGLHWLRAAERAGIGEARVVVADYLSHAHGDSPEADRLYFEAAYDGSLSARTVLALRYFVEPKLSYLCATTVIAWIEQSVIAKVPLVIAWLQVPKNVSSLRELTRFAHSARLIP